VKFEVQAVHEFMILFPGEADWARSTSLWQRHGEDKYQSSSQPCTPWSVGTVLQESVIL